MISTPRPRSPSRSWCCGGAGWRSTRRAPSASPPPSCARSTRRRLVAEAEASVADHRVPPVARPRPPGFLAQTLAITAKDLRIEWRSREIVYTTLFLAVLLVLVFAFAFISGDDATLSPGVIAGILWVAVLFSGTVALSR